MKHILVIVFGILCTLSIVLIFGDPVGDVFGLEHMTAIGVGLACIAVEFVLYKILTNYEYAKTMFWVYFAFAYMSIWSRVTHNRVLTLNEIRQVVFSRSTQEVSNNA